MTLDFPLILVILVFGSGLIWLIDALMFAPARRATVDQLRTRYPEWETDGSEHSRLYQSELHEDASEPVLVEYARSFFPVLFVVFVLRSFLVEPFQIPSSSMVSPMTAAPCSFTKGRISFILSSSPLTELTRAFPS